jgi:hypothetical protein
VRWCGGAKGVVEMRYASVEEGVDEAEARG